MARLDICRQCDRVVFTDDNDDPFVELKNGTTMHAACYERWQDEIEHKVGWTIIDAAALVA